MIYDSITITCDGPGCTSQITCSASSGAVAVKRIRRDRILAFGPTTPPSNLDDDGYRRWLLATQKAIADGTMTQPPALPPAADPPPEIAAQYADVLATTGEMP